MSLDNIILLNNKISNDNKILNDNKISNDNKIRTYFIPPAFTERVYEYQNINKDKRLRFDMTQFYYNKIIKWITNQEFFSKYKKLLPFLKTDKGFKYVYILLRIFIKRTHLNWYDLKDNYDVVKDFFQRKLISSP
jgi:hypothetical protein